MGFWSPNTDMGVDNGTMKIHMCYPPLRIASRPLHLLVLQKNSRVQCLNQLHIDRYRDR